MFFILGEPLTIVSTNIGDTNADQIANGVQDPDPLPYSDFNRYAVGDEVSSAVAADSLNNVYSAAFANTNRIDPDREFRIFETPQEDRFRVWLFKRRQNRFLFNDKTTSSSVSKTGSLVVVFSVTSTVDALAIMRVAGDLATLTYNNGLDVIMEQSFLGRVGMSNHIFQNLNIQATADDPVELTLTITALNGRLSSLSQLHIGNTFPVGTPDATSIKIKSFNYSTPFADALNRIIFTTDIELSEIEILSVFDRELIAEVRSILSMIASDEPIVFYAIAEEQYGTIVYGLKGISEIKMPRISDDEATLKLSVREV